jgi:hypothetical protein
MLYTAMLITIKVSILLSYKRIFGVSRWGVVLIWLGVFVVTVFYVICLLLSLLWCKPIAKAWFPLIEGACAPYDVHLILGTASGVVNIVTDFYVLILPMPFVWSLNMKRSRKVRVLVIFGLGLL